MSGEEQKSTSQSRLETQSPVETLDTLVINFNRSLKLWREETGCSANFSWKYDHDGNKVLRISEVVKSLYKEAPEISPEELKAAMDKFSK